MLTAVARRLKQLDKDASEAQRARVYVLKRRGELLPPPVRGGDRNPFGRSGRPEINSQHEELISTKPKQQQQLDWQAHKVVEHWDAVEPLLAKMKKPSPNAVMRGISTQVACHHLVTRHIPERSFRETLHKPCPWPRPSPSAICRPPLIDYHR
jgi:hypothetical protein